MPGENIFLGPEELESGNSQVQQALGLHVVMQLPQKFGVILNVFENIKHSDGGQALRSWLVAGWRR
jgi:hypothetical protein